MRTAAATGVYVSVCVYLCTTDFIIVFFFHWHGMGFFHNKYVERVCTI